MWFCTATTTISFRKGLIPAFFDSCSDNNCQAIGMSKALLPGSGKQEKLLLLSRADTRSSI